MSEQQNNNNVEDSPSDIHVLASTAMKYVDTRLDLFKLSLVRKSADGLSSLISRVVVFIILIISLFMLSTGAAIWLGHYFDRMEYGFFAVAAFYLIIGIVFYLLKGSLVKGPVSSAIIKKALK